MEASMEVPAQRGTSFHPLAPLGRSWRRLRRRPRATQIRTALIAIALPAVGRLVEPDAFLEPVNSTPVRTEQLTTPEPLVEGVADARP